MEVQRFYMYSVTLLTDHLTLERFRKNIILTRDVATNIWTLIILLHANY